MFKNYLLFLQFKFNNIFNDATESKSEKGENRCQAAVYETVGIPLVGQFIEKGFNCCLLAYGQTGAGKTYTLAWL